MEKERIPFPTPDLFPRLSRVAHFLLDHLHTEGLSSHIRQPEPKMPPWFDVSEVRPYGTPIDRVRDLDERFRGGA